MDSDDSQEYVLVNDEDVNDSHEAETLPQTPEVLANVQKWLNPTEYHSESSEYRKHLNSYLSGTGEWVQQTDTYQKWHSSHTNGSLWLKATAGSGKSVLAAILADKLAKAEKVPVLYFFFRQIIATNHDPQSMVRDFISMILNNSPPLQASMKKYMDERRGLETISANELWQHLVNALTSIPKVYCVVDALDEMDIDKQDFFANLVNLGKRKPSSIKLLITSRPLPRIEAYFRVPSVLQIRLEPLKVDRDIALYVEHRLAGVDAELKTTVMKAIGDKAQGSFLYARLMMDELLDHLNQMIPDIKYIQRSLSWLPLTLEDMYNGMLLDHSLRSRVPQELQLTILQWVTHSSRPLRLLEIATIIDIQSSNGRNSKDSKALARAACGPLLEILEDETVSVIHHSFTEFLTDEGRRSRAVTDGSHPQFPTIDSVTTHRSLALICLKYLNSGCLSDWKMEERKEEDEYFNPRKATQQSIKMKHPFLDYAMNNFHVHVSKHGFDEPLLAELDKFMTNSNPAFSAWVNMIWSHTKDSGKVSPLHVAAWAGMTSYAEHLLQSGIDNNSEDGRSRTPLSWACAKGHTKVVAVLLQHVADPDVDDYNGLKPLHYAAQGNHHQIVKLLVAAGVSPLTRKMKDPGRRCGSSPGTVGHTPLMYATEAGSIESVREMLPVLKLEDLHQALIWASRFGRVEIVDLLLSLPDVSANPPGQLDTPLFLAASGLHVQVVNSLLEHGADPNKVSENASHNQGYTPEGLAGIGKTGPSPLHGLCGGIRQSCTRPNGEEGMKKMIKCFHLLHKFGCNLNPVDKAGQTPLHQSVALAEHNGLATLLLDHGADPTMVDFQGNTPLHLLRLHECSGPLIEKLIAKGADMNVRRSSDKKTPLHCMMDSFDPEYIEYLRPHVEDWNVADINGDTPLHIFLPKSPEATGLKVLLDVGADIHRQNKRGETSIHVAKSSGVWGTQNTVCSTLLAAGANLETKDYNGRTVLSRLIDIHPYDYHDTVRCLIELGAKVDCRDFQGNSILHQMCKEQPDISLIKLFIDAGVDPLCVNHSGNNVLHELVYSESHTESLMETVSYLLQLNVPPTAKNHAGQTPLHLICSQVHTTTPGPKTNIVDFALQSFMGASINDGDNNGIRPIHLAATISEQLVSKLLDNGAQMEAVTNDGLNILHVAARARQTNIVGLVVDKLMGSKEMSLLHAADDNGRTPLHHACRSGRPETVAILLKAGADVTVMDKKSLTPLHACAEFEEENLLWSTTSTRAPRACGILVADNSRPAPQSRNTYWHSSQSFWASVSPGNKSARIREIIRMLIQNGAVIAFAKPISSPIDLAVQRGCADMVDELLPLMEPIYSQARKENRSYREIGGTRNDRFQEKYLVSLCNPALTEEDAKSSSISNDLLALGRIKSIEKLPELGVDFYPNPGHHPDSDFLTTLVRCGYADLFAKLGKSITTPGWLEGAQERNMSVAPYLMTAVSSDFPNLDVIKVIVETFGADVNVQPTVRTYLVGNYVYAPGTSPLHILSQGTRWWQTDAMRYLLKKGANPEAKDKQGRTVLHYALSDQNSWGNYRRRETVQLLLDHGANPNNIDKLGDTCLNTAMYDLDLVALLIKHGADVSLGDKPVLFAAITSLDVAAVSALLKAGADCNAKQKPLTSKKAVIHRGHLVQEVDSSPLHYIASAKFNNQNDRETAIEIINLLLQNGADPYLPIRDGEPLIHTIFQSGGIIPPFLELEDINLEHRNSKGQTVLLAACQSRWGINCPSNLIVDRGDHANREARMKELKARYAGDIPAFLAVFNRGGDLTAVDNDRNTAFHFLAEASSMMSPSTKEEFEKGLDILIANGAAIIDRPNIKGFTPLHIALAKGHWWAVRKFLDAGANPLLDDPNGNTPLHHLASGVSLDLNTQLSWMNRFLALGIPLDSRNNAGETPFFKYFAHSTVTHDSQEPFTTFITAGADLFTTNKEGETLLHVVAKKVDHGPHASLFGRRESAVNGYKFLMKKGLDPMAEDKGHRTPLDVAAACSNNDVLDLFKRDRAPTPEVEEAAPVGMGLFSGPGFPWMK